MINQTTGIKSKKTNAVFLLNAPVAANDAKPTAHQTQGL